MRKVTKGSPTITLQSNVETRLGLSDEQATALYRIAQEALANALKHAQARKVVVTLETGESSVWLGIADDGLGVPEEREGHYGLAGMRERAAMIGARLDVTSPGRGVVVDVLANDLHLEGDSLRLVEVEPTDSRITSEVNADGTVFFRVSGEPTEALERTYVVEDT